MIEIENYNINEKIPYYVHCQYSLVHEMLVSQGCKSILNLHLNASLFSIQTYSRNDKLTEFKINEWERSLLGYKSREEILGFKLYNQEFSSFEEGIDYLKSSITQNKLSIVGGTVYHLPYTFDYHNSEYFNGYPKLGGIYNHWIIVCGLDNKKVKVRDTTPKNFIGWIDIDEFKNFWLGDKSIPELMNVKGIEKLLCFGSKKLEITKQISDNELKDICYSILKTITFEYLEGKTLIINGLSLHHGRKAFECILDDLVAISIHIDAKNKIEKFCKIIQEMKFSRYFLRDLLGDLRELYGKHFYGLYEQLDLIAKRLEKIAYKLSIEVRRNKDVSIYIYPIIQEMHEIYKEEVCFYEKFNCLLKGVPLLEKDSRW